MVVILNGNCTNCCNCPRTCAFIGVVVMVLAASLVGCLISGNCALRHYSIPESNTTEPNSTKNEQLWMWSHVELCTNGSVLHGTDCVRCPPGTFPGEDECMPCPANTFSDAYGAASCIPCPIGTVSNQTGGIECDPCPSAIRQGETCY